MQRAFSCYTRGEKKLGAVLTTRGGRIHYHLPRKEGTTPCFLRLEEGGGKEYTSIRESQDSTSSTGPRKKESSTEGEGKKTELQHYFVSSRVPREGKKEKEKGETGTRFTFARSEYKTKDVFAFCAPKGKKENEEPGPSSRICCHASKKPKTGFHFHEHIPAREERGKKHGAMFSSPERREKVPAPWPPGREKGGNGNLPSSLPERGGNLPSSSSSDSSSREKKKEKGKESISLCCGWEGAVSSATVSGSRGGGKGRVARLHLSKEGKNNGEKGILLLFPPSKRGGGGGAPPFMHEGKVKTYFNFNL